MTQTINTQVEPQGAQDDDSLDLLEILTTLAARWRLLIIAPLAVGVLALGIAYLVAPTYTAQTIFLPPQQQQSAAASALASLGALSGLAGGIAGIKTPGDQYIALLQSVNVEDRIVDRFDLMTVYDAKYRILARKDLESNVRISLGKKDGLITIEADAKDPSMAADIANQYVVELRRLIGELALTEAQQRRKFFETEVANTHTKLISAQLALQSSGFNPGALKAEPKAVAEGYARAQAEVTSSEVRLKMLRNSLAETSPEVQQQLVLLSALKDQLQKLQNTANTPESTNYIGNYREFKYQEALFDLFSKQYEMARLDESREGSTIQVVDIATKPERKSKPKRAIIALSSAVLSFAVLSIFLIFRRSVQVAALHPDTAMKFARLRATLRG